MERKSEGDDILNHIHFEIDLSFQMVCGWLYSAAMNCWSAFLFWHSTIWGGGSRLFQSHSKFTKAGCFSPKKSQSMLLNVIPTQHFGEFSVSLAKQTALSNAPLIWPPPLVPFCLPVSLSLPVTVAHSQVDGRHQKGWVGGIWDKCVRDTAWYRWRGTSLSEPVSGHIHNWETTDDAEERITRAITQGQGGTVEVTVEREYRGAEGSSGRVWAGPPAHVPSFKLCFYLPDVHPPPSTCHSLPPRSFSTCRAPSTRSALTGPSCMRALWPTALFDFVFVFVCAGVCVRFCTKRGGGVSLFSCRLKGLIFVAGLSDLRSLHARSMPAPSKWQRLMRATRPSDGCPLRQGICSSK